MTTPDVAGVMAAAMNAENGRRVDASTRPGHGAPVPLAQPTAGAGVGISDVPLPVAGMGYSEPPVTSEAQVASYVMPNYAPDSVGGFGFQAGRNEPPIRRHVTDLGDGRLFIEWASAPAEGFTVVSPPAPRPGLLSRAAAGVRRLLGRH